MKATSKVTVKRKKSRLVTISVRMVFDPKLPTAAQIYNGTVTLVTSALTPAESRAFLDQLEHAAKRNARAGGAS